MLNIVPVLDEVGAALKKVTFAESIVLLGDFNTHVGTTVRHERVLLEDKETPTLTEMEGFCCNSVAPMDCA